MIVRLTLAALFVIPAAMAYPWQTTQDRWLLGVAVAVVVILFAWWRGLFVTTMIARRVAMMTRRGRSGDARTDEYATVALRVEPAGAAEMPLDLLAGYLDRYGISFDKVRVLSRQSGPERTTWVTLTLGAADNIAALSARSSQIPLRDTAELSARRLADNLRETGWDVSVDDAPVGPVADGSKETWRGVTDGNGYVAAYRIAVTDRLADTLQAVRESGADEIWTAVELTGSRTQPEVAAACSLRTSDRPAAGSPLSGLTPERGLHGAALSALHPASDRRLPAPGVRASRDLLAQVRWPAGVSLSRT